MDNNRIFIGQFLPQKLMIDYSLSQAANNFCYKIIELRVFKNCISIPPLNVKDHLDFYSEGHSIRYYTCRIFPHTGILKYLNLFCENISLYFIVKRKKGDNVWFYNVYKGNVLLFYLLHLFSKKKLYVLLADYNPERASGFFQKLIIVALKKCRGIISLSSRCSELNSNFLSIPGILNENQIRQKPRPFNKTKKILLSGTLNENTGLFLAIDAFQHLPEYTLILSGNISNEVRNQIDPIVKKYSNIILMDFIEDYNEYLKLLNSVDFVLSLRNEQKSVNKYNFPSKILESLSFNIPVLSTIKYPELNDIKYFVADYSVEDLINAIHKLYNNDSYEQVLVASDNYEKLKTYYTSNAWIQAFDTIEKMNLL